MPIIHPFIRHVHRFIIDCFSGQVRKLTRVIVIVQLATSFDWTMKPTRSGWPWPWPPTVGPGRRRRTKTALLIAYSQINRAATDVQTLLVVVIFLLPDAAFCTQLDRSLTRYGIDYILACERCAVSLHSEIPAT